LSIINKKVKEVFMAKAGMRRPDPGDPKSHGTEGRQKMNMEKNPVEPVPEIKHSGKKEKKKYM
jgi:hypothetical protein